jgi:hypothetical protein
MSSISVKMRSKPPSSPNSAARLASRLSSACSEARQLLLLFAQASQCLVKDPLRAGQRVGVGEGDELLCRALESSGGQADRERSGAFAHRDEDPLHVGGMADGFEHEHVRGRNAHQPLDRRCGLVLSFGERSGEDQQLRLEFDDALEHGLAPLARDGVQDHDAGGIGVLDLRQRCLREFAPILALATQLDELWAATLSNAEQAQDVRADATADLPCPGEQREVGFGEDGEQCFHRSRTLCRAARGGNVWRPGDRRSKKARATSATAC